MPIPRTGIKFPSFASISIEDEVLLARLNYSSRFSFIRSSALPEMAFQEDLIFPLVVTFEDRAAAVVFETEDILSEDVILGTFAIGQLAIRPTLTNRFPF